MTTRYQAALQAYAEGRYEEAMEKFSELLYEDPRNPKLHIWLGSTFRKAGKVEYARVQYQQVLALTDDPDLVNLAQASLEQMQNHSTPKFATAGNVKDLRNKKTSSNKSAVIQSEQFDQNGRFLPPPPNAASSSTAIGAQSNGHAHSSVIAEQQEKHPQEHLNLASNASSASKVLSPTEAESLPKSQKLRQRLATWAIALAVLPVAVVGVATYQIGSHTFLTQAKQTKEVEANGLANALNQYMFSQYQNMAMLGSLFAAPVPNKPLTPRQKQLFQYRLNLYKNAYENYNSIALFDTSGKLVAQSTSNSIPNTIAPEQLQQLLTNNSTVISEPVLVDQEYAINFATPVIDPSTKQIFLVLQSQIPLKFIQKALQGANEDDYFVVDAASKYVLNSDQTKIGTNAIADYDILTKLQTDKLVQAREFRSLKLGSKFIAYAPTTSLAGLPDLNWHVVVSADRNTVLAANGLLFLVCVVGIGVTPLLVGAIAHRLSGKFTQPIHKTTKAIRDIAKGKLETQLEVESYDEFAELAISVNAMTEQFQTLLREQRQEKERLQQQVMKMFKAMQKLAQVEADNLKLSDDSIGLVLRKIQTSLIQKDVELNRQNQERYKLQKQLVSVLNEIKDVAKGDLTVTATVPEGDMANVAEFFNAVIMNLKQIVTQIKSTASQINYSIGQSEHSITHLSKEALKQADDVNRTLNAMQIMTISAQSVANSTHQVVEAAHEASSRVGASGKAIDRTMQGILNLRATVATTAKKVKRLGESSQRISKVISLINEIAVQTNFLAINASIEASRAGSEGRGFALVAQEVGDLAARSAAATKEIEQIISNIQTETSEVVSAMEQGTAQVVEGTYLVEDAKTSLMQITSVSNQIDELVHSISEATISQVRTSECVAALMKDIAQVSGRTAKSSQEVSKSLQTTVQVAEQLQRSVDRFKLENTK